MNNKEKKQLEAREDQLLIEAVRSGQGDEAFNRIVNRYSARVFALVLRLTRNREDAEEALQDVFVSVYRKLSTFEGKSTFSSWIYRIAVNAAFMKIRRKRLDNGGSLDEGSTAVTESLNRASVEATKAADRTEIFELRGKLEECVAALPAEYKPVFILRDVDGFTSEEVAKMLNISVPAVKSRLHRSRTILKAVLTPMYRDHVSAKAA